MIAIVAGIIIIIAGVLLWVSTLTLIHAMAVFMIVIGILIALTYVVPASYYRRRV